jgi:two-component system sensor histidine kinase CpxA
MRTIPAKILLWTLSTFVASLVAFAGISYYLTTVEPGPGQFFFRTLRMTQDEAVRSFEEGGPRPLATYLNRLDTYYEPARHFLTDPNGIDLATGEDRSSLVGSVRSTHPTRLPGGDEVFVEPVGGGRYRYVVILPRFSGPSAILPYFAGVVLAIGLLGYALAVHLARPIRTLREVVDRFGGGDLTARAGSARKDEIGELSRAFDAMAGQIETLRAAELRLLQDISHELRSPLARLGFNVELARSADNPEVPFARIKKDLDRLGTLVGEVLQLTCAEGDPISREREEVDLDTLMASLVEDCAEEASSKDCRLVLTSAGEASVIGDRELLRRGFENVLRNAIRYAPEGSAIEIETRVLDAQATITVRDHGPGVPEAALSAIFEPFFRVGDDRSRAGGGVGLGLAIAQRAIERHQGRVIARNADPGLRVFIDLPVEAKVPA